VHNAAFPSALLNEQNLDRPEAELAKITKEKVERSDYLRYGGNRGPLVVAPLCRGVALVAAALTALTRLFLPSMLNQRRGHILNMASVAGFIPGPLTSVYFASKHYVLAFSEALIEELRGTGVKVTVLCPPPVRTSFSNAARIASVSYMSTTKTTPAEVARYGYRMMKRGKPVAVYGPGYKFLTSFLVGITPRFALRRLVRHLNAQGSQ